MSYYNIVRKFIRPNNTAQYLVLGIFKRSYFHLFNIIYIAAITKQITISLLLFAILVFWMPTLTCAQQHKYEDTFKIYAGEYEDLFQFATYYIDSSSKLDVTSINQYYQQKKFKHWPLNTTFNIGLNPYPLWFHLILKNTNPHFMKYWWAIYSSSDSIIVYQKRYHQPWVCTDTLSYLTPDFKRKVPVRFPVIELPTQSGESVELLVKVRDLKTVQSFSTDLTTPEGNLLWEKNFHWDTGIFIGIFLMFLIFAFGFAILLKTQKFVYYSCYICVIILISLKEEYLIGMIDADWLFNGLNRLHGMSLSIIGMALHYQVLLSLFIKKHQAHNNILFKLAIFNTFCLLLGIISLGCLFVLYPNLHLNDTYYHLFWYGGIGLIFLMAVNAIATLILRASGWVQKILYTFYGSLLVYFSISGFYINYTGLVSIYPITYPNYYYEVLILQLSAITLVIILKYKHMFNENILLLNQKIQLQKEMHQEIIAAQVEERRKIARDLHDDMGATLSTVNLLFTDQYPHNIQLLKLIRKACNDIRVFAKKFSIKEMKDETLSNTLNAHLEVLNAAGKTQFSLVVVGQEPVLEEEIKYNLVRIAFELLTNILKHSNAQNATVQLVFEQNQLLIITEDDGIGYDIHLVSKGNGLANMEKRASQISASLHVSSDKKGTTTILNMTIK